MQTKFYWISFLVLGFGQRSDFPSECALSAEGGGGKSVAHKRQSRGEREREREHNGVHEVRFSVFSLIDS